MSMKNADMPVEFIDESDPEFIRQCRPMKGLTKREYAAIQIMAGLASDPDLEETADQVATIAVSWADNLFSRLEETQ